MDNPETLAALGTQDEDKHNTKNTTQHRNLKRLATQIPPKTGSDPQLLSKGKQFLPL